MLSSSQVQPIEDALKQGKIIKRFTDRVVAVEYPPRRSPVIVMLAGIAMFADDVRADEILIGDYLHKTPH
jgi:hypothetical protein